MSTYPPKFILNPINSSFKIFPMKYINYPYLDFSHQIRWSRKRVPIELYSQDIKNISDVNKYKINKYFI